MEKLKLLISSILVLITFLVSISGAMQNTDEELTHSNIKLRMRNIIAQNPDILNTSVGKDVVVFLGDSKSGKSTLINYLSKIELEVDSSDDIILQNDNNPLAMKIGGGSAAETLLPKSIIADGLWLYDMPGLKDPRGKVTRLLNAGFITRIMEKANTFKLVFVVGMDQITSNNGSNFKELLARASTLIKNEQIENFSSLIITKNTKNKSCIHQYITRMICPMPNILQSWIVNNRIGLMSVPYRGTIDPTEREDILDIIKGIDSLNNKGTSLKSINIFEIFEYPCLYKDNREITQIYKTELQEIIDEFTASNHKVQSITSLDRETLSHMVSYIYGLFSKECNSFLSTSPILQLLQPMVDFHPNSILDINIKNIAININQKIEEREYQEYDLWNSGIEVCIEYYKKLEYVKYGEVEKILKEMQCFFVKDQERINSFPFPRYLTIYLNNHNNYKSYRNYSVGTSEVNSVSELSRKLMNSMLTEAYKSLDSFKPFPCGNYIQVPDGDDYVKYQYREWGSNKGKPSEVVCLSQVIWTIYTMWNILEFKNDMFMKARNTRYKLYSNQSPQFYQSHPLLEHTDIHLRWKKLYKEYERTVL